MNIETIKQLARDTTRQYNPQGLVPFPFDAIVDSRGDLDIFYSTATSDDISGAIFLQDDRFTILINSTKPNVRQYFTIAHELGHYFIHREWLVENSNKGFVDYSDTLDGQGMLLRPDAPETMTSVDLQKEREANNFAAELLMPESEVRQVWELTHDIVECAKTFQVSRVAMAVRLERLALQ